MAIQISVPASDTERFPTSAFPDGWLNGSTGGTTDLYQMIDETYLSSAAGDYIRLPNGADSGDHMFTAKLTNLIDPTINVRHRILMYASFETDTGAGSTGLIVEIRQGYVDHTNPGTLIFQYGITGGQFSGTTRKRFEIGIGEGAAANITDYTDLYVRFIAVVQPGGAHFDGMVVYLFNLIVPGVPNAFGSTIKTPWATSPIYGELKANPSVNGEALWQLLNASANRKIIIYELKMWGASSGTHAGLNRQARYGVRRTEYPYDVGSGGSIAYANPIHLDSHNTNTIYAILRSIDFANSQFHNIDQNFEYEFENLGDVGPDTVPSISDQWAWLPSTNAADQPYYIRAPGSFPWTIMPGSALEVAYLDNNNGATIVSAVWDEVPITS